MLRLLLFYSLFSFLILICFNGVVFAEKLATAKYKLRVDSDGFYKEKYGEADVSTGFLAAGKGSVFYVYASDNKLDNNGNVIKFNKVVKPECASGQSPCTIVDDRSFYFLYNESIRDNEDIKIIPRYKYRKKFAIDHGLLIVPFKYRTSDGTLSGESSLGYYVGPKTEWLMGSGTVFLSAGLSRLAINDVNQHIEHRTGVTVSAGIVLSDSNNFQVAFVSGLDHLGGATGKSWEYEDDVWLSFAIGYNFATSN